MPRSRSGTGQVAFRECSELCSWGLEQRWEGSGGRSGQGLMSWAEVGFIPGAEGTTQGPRSESDEARVSAASAGRPKGSVGCGTGCGDGQRFWGHQLLPVLTTWCLGHHLGSRETQSLRAGRDQALTWMRWRASPSVTQWAQGSSGPCA